MRIGTELEGSRELITGIASKNPYVIFRALNGTRCSGSDKVGLYFCPERGLRYVNVWREAPLAAYGILSSKWLVVEDFTSGDSTYKLRKSTKGIYKVINLP